MAADRPGPRALCRVRRARTEPSDSPDDRPRLARGRRLHADCPLVRARYGKGTVASSGRILQSCRARLRFLWSDRTRVQFLSFWIMDPNVSATFCERAAAERSETSGQFSLEHAISRGIFRRAVQAGEIHFSV